MYTFFGSKFNINYNLFKYFFKIVRNCDIYQSNVIFNFVLKKNISKMHYCIYFK